MESGPTCFDVVVTFGSSTTVEEKFELVDTCTLYEVAPLEAFQESVNVDGCPVEPLAGDASTGADGGVIAGAAVVKFNIPSF